ncbi:hypothetical protein [Microvirga aerophila]|uniref:Uncharacterized protein n=1 Tax=Microvirga aerophila TaxID=670291 RepID=A0A512C485_9HYPH|nr:hypothetical protein [Microvirga aerophila]GEO18857.1 hypothetical protein MAE02_65530 [Microvirga aerophila]
MTGAFMERSGDLMRWLPMFQGSSEDDDRPGITSKTEFIATVDWEVRP